MSRQRWRIGAARITEDEVKPLVAGPVPISPRILDEVLDDEAGLAQIYAAHGQQPHPRSAAAAPAEDDESGQVQVVCDRIAMLETTLAQAARPGGPSMRAGYVPGDGPRFLFELRSGLASRSLSAEDAFRLLSTVPPRPAGSGQDAPRRAAASPSPAGARRFGELRELTREMTGQLDGLDKQVMRLFGHSDDPAAVPAPQPLTRRRQIHHGKSSTKQRNRRRRPRSCRAARSEDGSTGLPRRHGRGHGAVRAGGRGNRDAMPGDFHGRPAFRRPRGGRVTGTTPDGGLITESGGHADQMPVLLFEPVHTTALKRPGDRPVPRAAHRHARRHRVAAGAATVRHGRPARRRVGPVPDRYGSGAA